MFWVTWSEIPGLGPILIKRIQQHFGTLSAAWFASETELQAVEGIGYKNINIIREEKKKIDPEKFLITHSQKNPHFWTPSDPEYPRLLLEISSAPTVLYYRGKWDLQENEGTKKAIAIVGTRSPSDYGKYWTRKIVTELAKNDITIVSGLAEGIDTEAHQTCLDMGKRTIAVVGTGVDVVYPSKNKKLYQQIEKEGLIISEYPAGTRPDRTHFPRRNRIIAGLTRATLVTEAPLKSGALITADQANEFGRDVYALPGRIDDNNSQGCLELINNGAYIIYNIEQLLEKLGAIPQIDKSNQLSLFIPEKTPKNQPELPPELQQIFNVITTEPILVDVIVQKSGGESGAIFAKLLELELMGLVTQLPGGRYTKNRR
jgi:DNA processing protein